MTERTPQEPWGLIDTSVVIAQDVGPLPGSLAISAVTLAELHFGVLVARSAEVRAERLRRLSILQHRFDALPLDEMVAASHGRLAAGGRRAFRPRSFLDRSHRPSAPSPGFHAAPLSNRQ